MQRNIELEKVKSTDKWDFIVIGGGASGLGIALDAASRGYKTLLLEGYDFAKGTSSRSTKLVHGGVRYLAAGDVALVREALRERGRLAKNASHLFKNQNFIIPNYNFIDSVKYRVGLGLYDYLSGDLSLGKTTAINKDTTMQRLPTLNGTDLKNGVVYKDGQFDDSRLAVNIAQTVVEQGGTVLNYAKVTELLKDGQGKINGVKFTDELNGEQYSVHGTAVINATGVFMNEVLSMDHGTDKKFVVPSQGVHLVLDKSFLPSDDALMIPKTSDGRVLFAVPWHERLVVGTTDTLVKEPSYEPIALEQEIQFILDTAGQYLTKKPTRDDVLSIFAGLRPLAAPEKAGQSTKEVSRSHKVVVSDSGLVTITGGKWTIYRQMSEDTVDEALKVHPQLAKKACVTTNLAIHGKIPAEQVDLKNHLYIYGADIPAIKALEAENPAMTEKIHPRHPNTIVEVVWAARQEMAQSVEDVLARRVRLLFLDARAAMDSAAKVANILAKELGKDAQWEKEQTEKFLNIAKHYLLVDYTPQV
ncbi:glycerol-3-phosphate dehydrogenase/oxidase [Aggregatibacter actinomycetemcomitans]|uniref:glycerol-3-phosphate dehydrogenase/oxidase n=1 Tax=Aggregatibacter actinomycetemcomitans TaxID=714 RepID=UPI0011DC4A3F|nr:glycerol-3-phosphate dehydrogenase/oxidase [Aggregatibacter actinomycetemcomitans]QEH45355.1 glycerol-3-phosphate dehydrogenase/oxidase [Aggregatibacter actinomycetemcomitans]QEH49713.1 glycerol-3-phosphate dehydrogenase/oxidase [Aggregatibacter actinomycetemcomitans]TYA51822.1 glycerol-3-phosphate dehydrogenase/oxidase [Aggregatibacter actinomycetemcomitans]TYB29974.1 glycerol-3-phosphate dehydrogenase/oxidase [Aggregatibacter actinomycetemcomitans]